MDDHASKRPERDCMALCSAIKDGSSCLDHNERKLKWISLLVPLLQCGAFASPRSLQTSQWCWENGWCCPAWSSTTAASSSGPRTAWPSASERVSEVRKGKKSCGETEREREREKTLQLHQAAGIKVKGRRGVTQPRFRFSFYCKNPDKSYYACKV